jgi:RNA recognition motif-containing protein
MDYARIQNVRVARNFKTGLSCCFAFLEVHNEDLEKFLKPKETLLLDQRPLFFQLANAHQSEKSKNGQKRVYLKNLPIKNPIQDLAMIFS